MLARWGRAAPILLAGAYAAAVTVGFHEKVPTILAVLGWLLLCLGLAQRGRLAIPLALYGFGGLVILALLLATGSPTEVPPAFQFLGWLAFTLAWGTLSDSPWLGILGETSGQPVAEMVSEGHQPLRQGGAGAALLITLAALAAVAAELIGPHGSVEQGILGSVAFVGLGVLLLSLAGQCAARALELRVDFPRGRLLAALALWLVGTLGLLGAAERFARQTFGLAGLWGLATAAAGALGLRLVRSAREN